MDFRIITLGNVQQILLERIDDDDGWLVFISTYISLVDRYDEWYKQEAPMDAQNFILTFSQRQADEFINRANAWYERREKERINEPA